ncbi:MAG: hypothetical protein WDW38_006991 [Sanguina aurantia]
MRAAGNVCDYEEERESRMAENKRKIQELGLAGLSQAVIGEESASQPQKKGRMSQKDRDVDLDYAPRISGRVKAKVSYCEAGHSDREAREPRGPPGPAEVERLRKLHGSGASQHARPSGAAEKEGTAAKPRKAIDSGKGVRIQGGRVYDSSFGVTCHWCRQKTVEEHVTCTLPTCGNGRRLATTFCKMCLRNRHGESVDLALGAGKWVCPGCRGSCGYGCLQCCNCGPCRKKGGQDPTHQVLKSAKDSGFNNVHDFLIHLTSGESAEEIAARKVNHPWGHWMRASSCCAGGGACSSGAEDSDKENKAQEEAPAAAAAAAAAAAEFPHPTESAQARDSQVEEVRPTLPSTARTAEAADRRTSATLPTPSPTETTTQHRPHAAAAAAAPTTAAAATAATLSTRQSRAALRSSLSRNDASLVPSAAAAAAATAAAAAAEQRQQLVSLSLLNVPNVVAPKRRRANKPGPSPTPTTAPTDVNPSRDDGAASEMAAASPVRVVASAPSAEAGGGVSAVEVSGMKRAKAVGGGEEGAVEDGKGKASQDAPPTPQTMDKPPEGVRGRGGRAAANKSKAAGRAVPVLLAF